MRNRTGILFGTAIAVVLTAFSIANTGAAPSATWIKRGAPRPSSNFGVSGEFTGNLVGNLLMDGVSYRLAPDAILYEIGHGLLAPGTLVPNRHVFLSGQKLGDLLVVTTVIVRPFEDMRASRGDTDGQVQVMDSATPR